MITKHEHKGVVWVDVSSPDVEDIKLLMNDYNIDPLIAEDLLNPTPRQKIFRKGEHIYAVLHFPAFKQTHSRARGSSQEVDFVLGKNLVITTHYDTIDAILLFNKEVETEELLNRKNISFFYSLLKNLYSGILNEVNYLESWLSKIEGDIFLGKERDMVIELSRITRNIINLKQTVFPHQEVLDALELMDTQIAESHFSDKAYSNIKIDFERITKKVTNLNELIIEMRDTNDSLLSTKQNEIMKTLTLIAFTTLPASLIAGIFNMNVNLPIAGHPYDFAIVMSIMVVITFGLIVFFKKKKWF